MHRGRGKRYDEYLECTNEEKDLGVIFTPDLELSRQVTMAANKANRVIGAIRRSFRCLYNYTSQWLKYALNMHTQCGIQLTKIMDITWKKVQWRATEVVPGIRGLPHEERLGNLKLPSLVYKEEEI